MIDTTTVIIFSFLAALVKFLIAYIVYSKNKSSEINKIFALLFFSQGIWDLGKGLMWMSTDASLALIFGKFSYTGYMISIFIFPHFAWSYLKRKNFMTHHIRFWYMPLLVLIFFLWRTDAIISGLLAPENSTYGFGIQLFQYEYGLIYNYFFIWFQSLALIYCLSILLSKYLKTHLKEYKNRLKYLVIGVSIPIVVGIPTGVILPFLEFRIFPHNNILTTLMSLFIGYGILKYKFLNIKPLHEASSLKVNRKEIQKCPIDIGSQYLVATENARQSAYNVLLDKLQKKSYGLIISTTKPSLIRKEFNLKSTPIIWLTDSETEELSIGSNEIQQLFETISDFTKNIPNSVVLIDGLNYLIQKNNFSKILFFAKSLKSRLKENKSSLLIPLEKYSMTSKENTSFIFEYDFLPSKTSKLLRRTELKKLVNKKSDFVAFGYDNTIESLIKELTGEGQKIKVISLNHKTKSEKGVNYIESNPLKTDNLRKHIKSNTVAFISLINDSDTILCINILRSLSDKIKIIANMHRNAFVPIAEKAGADYIVPSSALGGHLLSISVNNPNVIQWIMDILTHTGKGIQMKELKSARFVGKSIYQADKILGKSANIVAIKTDKGLQQIPDEKHIISSKDKLLVVKG